MAGRLRQKRRGGQGTPRETRATTTLPLLEAAASECGVPRAFEIGRELEAAGYFEATLLTQWRMVQELLTEHLLEAPDALAAVRALGRHPEPKARFHAPGVIAGLLAEEPERALLELRPLAADADFRVAEAVQAFGVRPQAQTLEAEVVPPLLDWVRDPEPPVRRCAIEATRPRGVWVKHLEWAQREPAMLLPLLEPLRAETDPSVANAVGNCLNDLSKDHAQLLLAIADRWKREGGEAPLLERILAKGLRTLVKAGDPQALSLLGYGDLEVEVEVTLLNGELVAPNSSLQFLLEVRNLGDAGSAKLVYEIETPGRNEDRPRKKRYQGGTLRLPANDVLHVGVRERIFDRRATPLIEGRCAARFFLNGDPVARVGFDLVRPDPSDGA